MSSSPSQFQVPLSRAKKLAAAQALAVGAPHAVNAIPTTIRYGPTPLYRHYDAVAGEAASVAIRDLGPSRRVFLLQPHLTAEEMNGLAYRIRNLSKNKSLNSILVSNAPTHSDSMIHPNRVLPSSLREQDLRNPIHIFNDPTSSFQQQHVSGGYNARALLDSSTDEKRETLLAMQNLALACWGGRSSKHTSSSSHSRIPLITVPHGLVSDGGYALTMGSHVLATDESSLVVKNPQRGLTLDPIGLSYILPRLGQEFKQPSAKYPVGSILALTGYEANAADMVETGLATHYIESFRQIAPLERILLELPSWEQQKLIKSEKTWYSGQSSSSSLEQEQEAAVDINATFRNVSISQYLNALSIYDAAGQEFSNTPNEDQDEFWTRNEDPSLVLDHERGGQVYGDRESMLVNLAATFTFFEQEKSVVGIMERLKGLSARNHNDDDEEEKEGSILAKQLLQGMEKASPLALLATYRLMELGRGKMETLEQCMDREVKVQLNLFKGHDFQQWAKSGLSEGSFRGWKHKKVKDVTADEVEALFQE